MSHPANWCGVALPCVRVFTVIQVQHAGPAVERVVRGRLVLASLAWLAAVAGGFALATRYEQRPAEAHAVTSRWPAGTRCEAPSGKPMLVMFVHPKCPCTRASLGEIRNLQRECGDRLDVQFVFLQPQDAPWKSEETEHWQTVGEMGLGRIVDTDGAEHRRFGATTSGEVFLFAAGGTLEFHGGVTVARGHAGESPGRLAIESIIKNPGVSLKQTPAFGCPLDNKCQAACPISRVETVSQ